MKMPRHVGWMLVGSALLACPSHAQSAAETLPPIAADKKPEVMVPAAVAATNDRIYTTKKNPFGLAEKPAAVAPVSADKPIASTPKPAPIPFGKSTASMERPIPDGPHAARAVPVENVDMIETGEPAPAEPAENVANPVAEDPAQPTELSAPIFSPEKNAAPRTTILRVLNKVTARSEKIELRPDKPEISGKLRITANHCQHSDPTSLADDAALITVAEIIDPKQPDKPLFTGWMYQSSPSINGVEHPIYDVSLVACKDAPPAVAKPPVVETKPAKKKTPAQ